MVKPAFKIRKIIIFMADTELVLRMEWEIRENK